MPILRLSLSLCILAGLAMAQSAPPADQPNVDAPSGNFFSRFFKAYRDDWEPSRRPRRRKPTRRSAATLRRFQDLRSLFPPGPTAEA